MASTMELETLIVRLTGDGKAYFDMIKQAESATGKFGNFVTGKIADIGKAFQALGKYIALPIAALEGAAVNEFAKFNQAMTHSTAIIVNLTDVQKKSMADLAKELSITGIQGPTELAKAYYYLASAGFSAEQSLKVLPIVQQFATAGAFDLEKATTLASDALAALGLKSGSAEQIANNMGRLGDILVRANVLSNANVEQFSTALTHQAGAALKTFHKDAEEGVAVLAVMANQGIKAELAGNTLSRALRILSVSAVENADAHKRLGIEVFDEQGAMRNMADIVKNLEDALVPMSDELRTAELKALGFEIRLQQAILPLLGTSEQIREFEADLRAVRDEMKRVADQEMKSFTNQMKMAWNQVTVLAIGVGEMLAPAMTFLRETLTQVVTWLDKLDPAIKTTILVIIGMTAALIGFFAVAVTGFKILNVLTGGVPIIMGLILTTILATSVGAAVLVNRFGGIVETLKYLKEQGIAAWEWLKPTRKAVIDFFKTAWFAAHQAFDAIAQFATDTWNSITGGATINWEEVQRIIIKAIIGAEWVLLNFGTTWQLMWAGIKYYAVASLNLILENLKYVLASPAMVAMWTAHVVGWRNVFKAILEVASYSWKLLYNMAKLYGDVMVHIIEGRKWKEIPEKFFNFKLPTFKFVGEGIQIPGLKNLEKRLKDEFEKLGGEAAESFEVFYKRKLEELSLPDDIAKALDKPTGPNLPDLAKKYAGLGLQAGEEFNKGLSHQLGKLESVLFGSAEALSRIEEYRALLGGEYDPKHAKGGTGKGHAHEKKVLDYTLHQGAEGGTRKEAMTEKLLTDIRDILKNEEKRPEVKIEPAGFA